MLRNMHVEEQQLQRVTQPGFTPLSQTMLCAQVHAVGDVLHGPQLEKQAHIHQRQNQQTENRQSIELS